jgi:serine/threonine protein kinase/DNA-binding CsgD family transcriptional regulator
MKKEASHEEILFKGARQLPSAEARAAFLTKACGDDTALRERIEARLEATERSEDFAAQPPVSAGASSPASLPISAPSIALPLLGGAKAGDQPAHQAPFVVSRLGNYQLLKKLGEGGMGVVYKARQLGLKRLVALKVMNPAGQLVRRFKLETQALARLDHSNIVLIHEAGEDAGKHYFSMQLIKGASLAKQIDGVSADLRTAVKLVAKVAQAVHHAHRKGILHRDLKPSNILIDTDGEPHVTDFGLAKLIKQKADLTRSGMTLGTPDYMAPEQAEGKRKYLGKQTDIFSLGIILYELITGRHPFHRDSDLATLNQIVNADPERPSGINARVDDTLEAVCLKCLQKDPELRYDSAKALAEDLEHWLEEHKQPTRSGVGKPNRTKAKIGHEDKNLGKLELPRQELQTGSQRSKTDSFKRIRIIVADEHPIVRAGIREALKELPGVEVVGEASHGREAIKLVKSTLPDLVFMDISMPGLDGLEATERIIKAFPKVRVVIFSRFDELEYCARALRTGASGYLLKRAMIGELKTALQCVAGGELYLSQEISDCLRNRLPWDQIARARNPVEQLTKLQREILQLVAEGRTIREIAALLELSAKAVNYQQMQLMQRLDIFDIPGLVRFAVRTGLVSQES